MRTKGTSPSAKPAAELDNRVGKLHSCVFNPKGADQKMCIDISGRPAYAVRCDAAKCKSPWRIKSASNGQSKPEPRRIPDGLLEVRTVRPVRPTPALVTVVSDPPKKDPPQETEEVVQETLPPKVTEPVQENVDSSEEVSGEWQGVLERVKTAMANSTLIVVSPSAIRPMKGQPREFFSEISLNNLRQSIRQVGQIQAGIVRKVDDGEDGVIYELLDGERRWRVVLDEEDMLYRAQLVDIDDIAAPYMIAAIANFNREGHTPIEISDAIHKLRTGPIKVPMPAIAEIFGFGAFWVGQMHGLQNLHPDVRAMLDPSLPKEKVLPTTAAIHISKLDKDFQVSLAERVLAKEISISRLRREVVKTGDEQGRPVRTREVKPSKVLDSFVVRCGESARNALDILDRVAEMRNREILPMDSPRIDLALKSLDSAIKDLRLAREAVSTKKS